MPERYLLPIPMAHGRNGNTGFLSVYFSPRLGEAGDLSAYPDWKNWPSALKSLTFRVFVNGAQRPYVLTSPTSKSARWKAVFPETTPVKRWRVVDRTDTDLRTFDEAGFTSSVGDLYGRVAAAYPQNPPTVDQLLSNASTNTLLTGNASNSPLPGAQDYLEPIAETTPGTEPDVEFHNALMSLGAHPELLRLIGVVIDLEVSLPASPSNVRVQTNWATLFPGTGLTREVKIRMNTTSDFWMQPNPDPLYNEQVDGWTELADGDWGVTQVDALGATRQLTNLSGVLSQPDASGALPAPEEGGLVLMRKGHGDALKNLYDRRRAVENQIEQFLQTGANGVELFAEDVAQGERIDLKDNVSKKFLSVFQRQSLGYVFPRNTVQDTVPGPDEGWTTFVLQSEEKEKYNLVSPGDPEGGFDVYEPQATHRVRDAIFTWTGWSSVGPPPGKILDAEGKPIDPPENKVDPTADVQFESTYRPLPGTLPRLRYGRTYNFRARPVDISGGSRGVGDTHPNGAVSAPVTFGRGPVPPPTIVRSENKDPLPGVGEFVTTLVLLSDYNTKLSNVTSRSRILLPPKAAQLRLEMSGLPHGGIKPGDHALIAERDALSAEGECEVDPGSGELVLKEPSAGVTDPVAYFPDPAASGASLAGLPMTNGAKVIPFVGSWPDRRGVEVVARATGSGPVLRASKNGNKLLVTVPKAFDGIVDVSCSIVASRLKHFAAFNLLSSGQQSDLRNMMLKGRHWMISSRMALRIVHAVRRPMRKPIVLLLTATRPELDALEVNFEGQLNVHQASTDRTLLSATWEDPIDPPIEDAPTVLPGAQVIGTVVGTEVNLAPQFHDTKRHDIEVTAEAFSKFSSYFTEEEDVVFTTDTVPLDARGVVDSSVVLTDPTNGSAYARGADYTVDAAAGEVTRVNGGAIGPGDLVVARFIRLPTSRLNTEDSPDDTYSLSVPASSAPTAPRIREVVPAFSQTQSSTANSITRTRSGQVVRVWLERPWYSSGPGELLGVLVDRSPGDVPVSSRYGRDPVVEGPGAPTPALGDFARATSTEESVGSGLDVAGHEVAFDAGRKLWASDVEVAGNLGYRPFVRLSVARHQPIAIDGASVSTRVDLDPLRLGVVRTAKVTLNASGNLVVTLTGVEHDGIPDETNGGALLFNTVNVSFQTATPGVTDPVLKWQTQEGPVPATRTVLLNGKTRWRVEHTTALTAPIRVLIEESEPSMRSDGSGGVEVAREVVYVDTFALTSAFLNQ